MTPEMWYTLAILAAAIVLFITEWLRVDIVALGVVVTLMITGLLTTSEALSGFSNPVVLIVASLFIVGGAVLQTGLAAMIGENILTIAGGSARRLTMVVMLTAGVLSGFISDTGTVAVLLPAIISAARTANMSPSKLLIPLSYGALLGGSTTLIGTTPHIIVNDLLREEGQATFYFFSYTPIGLLMLFVGTAFMVMIGRRMLPDYKPKPRFDEQVHSPEELINLYRLPDNLFRVRVAHDSRLPHRTVGTSRMGGDFNINVLEIQRAPEPQALVRIGEQKLVWQNDAMTSIHPTSETEILPNDILIVQGDQKAVRKAAAYWNLVLQPVSSSDEKALVNQEAGIAEVVLPPRSSLLGKTLTDLRFGSSYKLTVLSISRPGEADPENIKHAALQFGDILLVQGYWHNIVALRKQPRDFVLLGRPESMLGAPNRNKAPLALLVLLGMLLALILGVADIATISMVAGLAMVLTGCLSMDEAYAAIDWKSIVLIAGMLPMSIALENAGLVALIAEELTATLGDLGPVVIMAGFYLLTALFTQVISNTATAVVLAPLAFATATELNVQPQAFLMTVSLAASMAFASPVASPVNTLVMGAGNYGFKDYIKVGMPMILLMLVVTTIGVPLLWPF